jgi:hypothetical protein
MRANFSSHYNHLIFNVKKFFHLCTVFALCTGVISLLMTGNPLENSTIAV